MISNHIRGARNILNMSQKDLGDVIGVNPMTIKRIEEGGNTKASNIRDIIKFFAENGYEVSGNKIEKITRTTKEYLGREGFLEFIWDVYNTVKGKGGTICVSGVDESKFEYWLGDADKEQAEKMASVPNLDFKILIKHGDTNFSGGEYADYRWVEEKHFSAVPFYVYGNKLATILFEDDVSVYVQDIKPIAEAQRKQFEIAWENADIPFIKGKTHADN